MASGDAGPGVVLLWSSSVQCVQCCRLQANEGLAEFTVCISQSTGCSGAEGGGVVLNPQRLPWGNENRSTDPSDPGGRSLLIS